MTEMNKINNEELVNVAGGNDGSERIGFTHGTVHDGVHYDASSCLTPRDALDGNALIPMPKKP